MTILAFILPLALYLAFPSTLWNFDGVACAAALELGNSIFFFHANHLLYGFLGYAFWNFLMLPLGIARALPALQLFTSLCSAVGLVGLYQLLRTLTHDRTLALLLTLSLGTTAAFWVWSVEAQVYTLGFLALAWASYTLLSKDFRRTGLYTGLWHAAAILGHIMHVLWIFPALYWMRKDRELLKPYLAGLFLGTIIPYGLVIRYIMARAQDPRWVWIWLKGSAALTVDRSWQWHWPGPGGLWMWAKSTLPTFWGRFWPYMNVPLSPWIHLFTGISIFLFVVLLMRAVRHRKEPILHFAGLWLLAYGLFLTTWEPQTLCYRITDVIPFGILFSLGLIGWSRSFQLLACLCLLVATSLPNAASRILPMHQKELNGTYQETLRLTKITPPNALFITEGGLSLIYLPYFGGRETWSRDRIPPDQWDRLMRAQKRLRPVYIQKGTLWEKVQ